MKENAIDDNQQVYINHDWLYFNHFIKTFVSFLFFLIRLTLIVTTRPGYNRRENFFLSTCQKNFMSQKNNKHAHIE
jgi:hypothetical protein